MLLILESLCIHGVHFRTSIFLFLQVACRGGKQTIFKELLFKALWLKFLTNKPYKQIADKKIVKLYF